MAKGGFVAEYLAMKHAKNGKELVFSLVYYYVALSILGAYWSIVLYAIFLATSALDVLLVGVANVPDLGVDKRYVAAFLILTTYVAVLYFFGFSLLHLLLGPVVYLLG